MKAKSFAIGSRVTSQCCEILILVRIGGNNDYIVIIPWKSKIRDLKYKYKKKSIESNTKKVCLIAL